MADRSLLDRLSRLVKIAPAENQSPNERSWSENSGKLLSTERKLYAIKVEDGEIIPSQFSSRKKKKKPELALKKWLAKCVPWKLPKAILLLSVLQVRKWTHFAFILSVASDWIVLINAMTMISSFFAAFFPRHWADGSGISNASFLSSPKTRAVAIFHLLTIAQWTAAFNYQRDSPAGDFISAWNRSRTSRHHAGLHWRCFKWIACGECDNWCFADGRSKLWNLQSADESCSTYLHGELN